MKLRMLKLSPESLIQALQGKQTVLSAKLPVDTELVELRYDLCSRQICAVVTSNSFEEAPQSQPIPELEAVSFATTLQPTGVVKVESKPLATPKREPAPIVKAQTMPARGTNKMEEEFSPEQRKLLSFKVEGEYVIVKPTQFLKAEWEDINETVRSLGGRWVKGDIISYWQIPLPLP